MSKEIDIRTWTTQGGPGKGDPNPDNPRNMTQEQLQANGLADKDNKKEEEK